MILLKLLGGPEIGGKREVMGPWAVFLVGFGGE